MKLNLHAHSKYSDGRATMEQMIETYKNNGYVCAVLTDHDYCFLKYKDIWKSTEEMKPEEGMKFALEKFNKQLSEAKELQEKYNFPVIIGMEISLWGEEAVLFGKEAIIKWLSGDYFSAKEALVMGDEEQYKNLSCWKERYGLIIVHPSMIKRKFLYEVAHGFEIMNCGQDFSRGLSKQDIEKLKYPVPYKGADAHSTKMLTEEAYQSNDVKNLLIKDENDIIDFIHKRVEEKDFYQCKL